MRSAVAKKNILGSLALVFAFIMPIVGLVLGILSVVFGVLHEDKDLKKDGIAAIVISVVVTVVVILLYYVLIMLGVAIPFVVLSSI